MEGEGSHCAAAALSRGASAAAVCLCLVVARLSVPVWLVFFFLPVKLFFLSVGSYVPVEPLSLCQCHGSSRWPCPTFLSVLGRDNHTRCLERSRWLIC